MRRSERSGGAGKGGRAVAGIDLRLNETLAPGDEIRCSRCNAIVELDACSLANPRPISDVLDRLDGGHSPRCPRAGGDEDTAPLPRFVRSVADQLTPDQRRTAGIAIGGLPPPPVLRVKSFSERHPLLEEFDDVNARIDALERQARPGEEERVSWELAKLRARRDVLEAAVDQLAADVQPSTASEIEAEFERLRAHLGLDGEDLEGLADEGDDDHGP